MSMYTALAGLNAAQTDLSVTSNNIANSATTGFRASRVNFGDIYSNSPASKTATTVGSGVAVQNVEQEFRQGSIVSSGNTLDLAIDGQGFFAVRPALSTQRLAYTRAGAFSLDAGNRVTDPMGQALMAFPTATDGTVLSYDLAQSQPLTVPKAFGSAMRTSALAMDVTLPGGAAASGLQDAVPPSKAFDPADATTFAASTALTVYDGSGNPAQAVAYFIRAQDPSATAPETLYQVRLTVAGAALTADPGTTTDSSGATVDLPGGQIAFDSAGNLIQPDQPLSFQGNGATGPLTLDLTGSGLGVGGFSVQSWTQDGQAVANLSGLEIDSGGTVWASYADGQSLALGRVALAGFANPTGLQQIGNASWVATDTSGAPITGMAGQDGFGSIRSGALESSNVDITQELVDLITEQRNYQASAKALQTMSTVEQAIIGIQN